MSNDQSTLHLYNPFIEETLQFLADQVRLGSLEIFSNSVKENTPFRLPCFSKFLYLKPLFSERIIATNSVLNYKHESYSESFCTICIFLIYAINLSFNMFIINYTCLYKYGHSAWVLCIILISLLMF